MTPDTLYSAFQYVQYAPYFWGSMGFTTALAMFVGALLYNGELTQIGKGFLSILSFASMLLWVTTSRVLDSIQDSSVSHNLTFAFAGIATILTVTLFWSLGLFIGVSIFELKYRNKRHKVL